MRWADIGEDICSVSRSLSVIGDRWSLLIIRSAFLGTRRFSDFQAEIGVTKHRLSDRLSKLVENGVFKKVAYQDNPPRFEYRLTEKGIDLYPVIMTLVQWGDKWMDNDAGKPIEHIHKNCGHITTAKLVCSHCSDELDPRQTDVQPGPALKAVIGDNDFKELRRFKSDT